jgi:hypothetical protein
MRRAKINIMKRAGRNKAAAWLCLTAVLFLQIAVAAYACPMPADEVAAVSTAEDSANPRCHGVDDARPKLCEQHCLYDAQTVDTQPHTAVQPPLSTIVSVVVRKDGHVPASSAARSDLVARAAAPPPLVRFGVLRI